jgi:hypothetical protein
MKRSRSSVGLLATAALLLAPGSSWGACGAQAVCGDVSSSLAGVIVLDTVTLTWSTDDENTSVASYKILRYDCSNPNTCSVDVAAVPRSGTCGTLKVYTYDDQPPSPVGSWTYTVEVWKTDGSRACAVDIVPQ